VVELGEARSPTIEPSRRSHAVAARPLKLQDQPVAPRGFVMEQEGGLVQHRDDDVTRPSLSKSPSAAAVKAGLPRAFGKLPLSRRSAPCLRFR